MDRDDAALLRGKVPQPIDWVDAWAEGTSKMSYRKQQTLSDKKAGSLYGRSVVKRRQRRHMTRILAEVKRAENRNHIRKATCLSLAIDESKRRRVLRFRCDAPEDPYVADGVIGVMGGQPCKVEELTADAAERFVKDLVQFLRKWCTPMSGEFDSALYDHLLQVVRVIAADGCQAERRNLFQAARTMFPNVFAIVRDIAHAARIACREGLHRDAVFGNVWEEMFGKRHALAPDIQHSGKWREMIQGLQQDVLKIIGDEAPLKTVLCHLAFAKQRFESFADPTAKLALLLLPIVALMAFIASDVRNQAAQRDRAVHVLRTLTSEFCTALGMSADYGLICHAFIKLFDAQNHDVARSEAELDWFAKTLKAIFTHGRLLGVVPLAVASAASAAENPSQATAPEPKQRGFITDAVAKQIRRKVVVRAGGEVVVLWGKPDVEKMRELALRSHVVVDECLDRLRADYNADLVRRDFACFDVPAIRKAFGGEEGSQASQRVIYGKLKGLALATRVDAAMAILGFKDRGFPCESVSPSLPLPRGKVSDGCFCSEVLRASARVVSAPVGSRRSRTAKPNHQMAPHSPCHGKGRGGATRFTSGSPGD